MLDDQPMAVPPEEGRPPLEVIEQAAREILPLAIRLDHPRCFGFIPSAPTWPGILADFLAAGYNVNACTWLVASGASQVELVVIDWFRRWLGFPDGVGGVLTSGGSAASVDVLYGTFALRLCIINHNTTWDDVRETLEAAQRFGVEASASQTAPK